MRREQQAQETERGEVTYESNSSRVINDMKYLLSSTSATATKTGGCIVLLSVVLRPLLLRVCVVAGGWRHLQPW